MRVATVDIGTNSVLLLIAERHGAELSPVVERAVITRLGRGVDATRALDPGAVEQTLACLAEYAAEIARAGAARVAVVGTSAMRDARGAEAFVAHATALLGVAPRIISGEEEAELTFAGALSGLGLQGPTVVFDLGGGSTELIRGTAGPIDVVERAISLDIGSVRLTERHVSSDPPSADDLEAVRRDTRQALASLGGGWLPAGARVDDGAPPSEGGLCPIPRVVGVAGTVTTLAAHTLGIVPYDAARVHGAKLSAAAVSQATESLARISLSERRTLPAIDPRRADVIVAGGVIVEELLAWAGANELLTSDRGVRWGLAKRLAALR